MQPSRAEGVGGLYGVRRRALREEDLGPDDKIRATRSPLVLVVEADPLVRMAAVSVVEKAGCSALRAANTDDAIAILQRKRGIWMVFADADVAGSYDGLALTHAVRRRWPPVHLFLASSNRVLTEAEMPERAKFFAKPYEEASLFAAIADLLGQEAPDQSGNGFPFSNSETSFGSHSPL